MTRSTKGAATSRVAGMLCLLCALAMNGCGSDAELVRPMPFEPAMHINHNSAEHAEKGYIDGWFNGENVSLHYTKLFFCAEPPVSGSDTNCALNVVAEVFPRAGNIPKIYAIAPVGFAVPVETLSCPPNSVCLNHPAMIDASRLGNPANVNVNAVPHSHIIGERGAGWHETVNVRVFNLTAWNAIVAAKSLAKIRELQVNPSVGVPGVISADTPTNIFFFIQVHRERP
jgi:hypothetical protein